MNENGKKKKIHQKTKSYRKCHRPSNGACRPDCMKKSSEFLEQTSHK